MKWISYAWTVLVELVTIVVAIGVLGKFTEPFQQMVIVVIVLIYLSEKGTALYIGLVI